MTQFHFISDSGSFQIILMVYTETEFKLVLNDFLSQKRIFFL